jgi:hypothetical protein
MKRVAALAMALLLAACTSAKPQHELSPAEARAARQLPAQMAHAMASPHLGVGCSWPISFDPTLMAEPDGLTATCKGLATGKRYDIYIEGRTPSELGGRATAMRIQVDAPGLKENIAVAPVRQQADTLVFAGKSTGNAVAGPADAVVAKLVLIGCETKSGAAGACTLDHGALIIVQGH